MKKDLPSGGTWDLGENWDGDWEMSETTPWVIPEGVKLDLSYCVNRYDAHFYARAWRKWEWYRNEKGVGAVNTTCLSDE